jgi:dihydrofolate synthase / folylpolyglutamate synthase
VERRFTYADALAALDAALTFGINPSLEPVSAIAEELARPQDAFASVQITGTNGKSSTARLTAAVLRAHGMRIGLYTSPELHSYTERIEVDGSPVSEELFAAGVRAALDAAGHARVEPTEFEILTAAALWVFREEGVDVAVLEVGMGGRWDATSVVDPAVAVITGVGLDHTTHLGDTREAIARDKAHIIKATSVPVLGPGTAGVDSPFLERAETFDARPQAVRAIGEPTPVAEEYTVRYRVLRHPETPDGATTLDVYGIHAEYPLLEVHAPRYQAANVATAVAAAEAAIGRALDTECTREAVVGVRFPGRFEVVARNPWVVVDGAHNPEAAAVLANAVRDAWPDPLKRPVADSRRARRQRRAGNRCRARVGGL